ncbi:MAG: cytochrome c [Hyphomicrobium sp.]|uniref:c-type cytochrome n=1 Tax=Hyphomicrobium sp. TaxID=82 RepID=UPI0039E2AF08
MSTLRQFALVLGIAAPFGMATAAEHSGNSPQLGRPMTASEVAKWDRTIFPDGRGLPSGSGTAKDGRALYLEKCASCHGDHGEGATAEDLIGGPKPPTADDPNKAIGSYWPFATTIFDFISRSMPPAAPGSLSADQTYELTAYLLAANRVVGESDPMTAETLPKVKMPNRDGFIWIDVKKKK